MPFTARDLRFQPEQSYPLLYAYLHRNAQRFLGSLKYDAFEVDTVIGHVVEQLVRLGLFGGGDTTPLTALDGLTDAQFYAFLSRSVRNKAIDRLRKRRLHLNTASELEFPDSEGEDDPLESAVESLWGETPFATPEEITLHLVSQRDLRLVLKHCISTLKAAPNQLQAVIVELRDLGADDLLETLDAELHLPDNTSSIELNPHMSQHKDHAHRKLRHCLQQQSSNLTVAVALRLTECTELRTHATGTNDYTVDVSTLAHEHLPEQEVRSGLKVLAAEGLLHWNDGEDVVHLTNDQRKRLARFYRDE